jgi:DNA-binding CsgD family transcriptional regulator
MSSEAKSATSMIEGFRSVNDNAVQPPTGAEIRRMACNHNVTFDPQALARLVETLETDAFFETLRVLINDMVPIDNCVALVYASSGPPVILHQWSPQHPNYFQMLYTQGAYILDPFYLASLDQRRCSVLLLREAAPDGFLESDFYKTYYQKVSMIDEIGLLSPLDDRFTIHLSLGRRSNSKPYSSDDLELMKSVGPVLVALLKRQTRPVLERLMSAGHAAGQSGGISRARVAGRWLEPYHVTCREAEIAEMILRGHSNASMGLILNISAETVKVHRRNLYSKMRISSQAELFLLFINHVMPSREQPAPEST